MTVEFRVLRSRTWNVASALICLVFAAVCEGLGLFDDPQAADHDVGLVFWTAAAALCVVAALRVLVVGVIATPAGLTIRELLRTTKLPWTWLSHVDVRSNHNHSPTLYNPMIHYAVPGQRGRRTVTSTALGAYRPEVAQAWADQLNALIRRHRR